MTSRSLRAAGSRSRAARMSRPILCQNRRIDRVVAPSNTSARPDGDEAVEGRLEAVRDTQVFLFVPLDHQFVHQHDVAIRDRIDRLNAQRHDRNATFVHLDLPLVTWDAVDPARAGTTQHFEVATPAKLTVLLLGEDLAQHLLGPLLRLTPVRASSAAAKWLMRQHVVRRTAQQTDNQQDEQQLERNDGDDHPVSAPRVDPAMCPRRSRTAPNIGARHTWAQPPATRGTMMICSAVRSNVSIRWAGFSGSTLKAVAPRARCSSKIRSASRTAASASGSPVCSFRSSHSSTVSPRADSTRSFDI